MSAHALDPAGALDDGAEEEGGAYRELPPAGGFDLLTEEGAGAAEPLLGWAGGGGAWEGSGRGAGWRGRLSRLATHEQLLALIAALLALVVVLLGVEVRVGGKPAAPLTPPEPHAPPPPSPAPPPPPGAAAPLAAWEAHLHGAGYAPTRSFLTLWWRRESNDLLLQVPASAHGALVLVNAEVSAADGDAYLLRQPLGDAFWQLAPSPDGRSLDVAVPPLAAARVSPRSTLAPAVAAGGLYPGWAYTLSRYDGGAGLGTASAADGSAGGAQSAFYLANDFLYNSLALSGALAGLDVPSLASARLAAAAGHPRNLELDVRGRANGTGVGVHLSLAAAPPVPMPPRLADARAGFFATCFAQLGAEPGAGPQQAAATQDARACVAHRWRLARAPSSPPTCGPPPAPPCTPMTPITYHLDPSIPDKWARCFAHGVTAWDAAFRAAGWAPGTIRALRPGDAAWPSDYAASDVRYASITFAPSLSAVYAVGPSTVDPRSGEILDADIMFAHSWVAAFLGQWNGAAGKGGRGNAAEELGGYARAHRAPRPSSQCFHHHHGGGGEGDAGGSGAGDLFRAAFAGAGAAPAGTPGDDAPVVPFAAVPARTSDAFVCEALAEVVSHEVGHTLGLRHNFAGSTAFTAAQVADPAFVAAHGTSGSVMDYLPPVMPSNRSAQGFYFSPVVGPYDIWAISIGYAPAASEDAAAAAMAAAAAVAAGAPVAVAVPPAPPPETAALLAQAGRPGLAFCTDDDDPSAGGMDAACSTYDLTADVLSYFRDRGALAAAAVARAVAAAVAAPDAAGDFADAYALARALLHTSSVSVAAAGRYAAKALGGAAVSRARYAQTPPGDAPVAAVAPATARDALAFLAATLSGESLYVPPAVATAMTLRGWRNGGALGADADALGRLPAPHVADARAAARAVLASALAPWRAEGMARAAWAARADNATAPGDAPVTAAEVVDTLSDAVWGPAFAAAARAGVPMLAGVSGADMCADDAALQAAAAELAAQSDECRALQLTWMAALATAAAAAPTAPPGTEAAAAAAAAARAEAVAVAGCLLQRSAALTPWMGAAPRVLRMHLLALAV